MPKFQISPPKKPRKNTLNHAATDTVVQRKLCPNSKFHPLKNLEKNMILKTYPLYLKLKKTKKTNNKHITISNTFKVTKIRKYDHILPYD